MRARYLFLACFISLKSFADDGAPAPEAGDRPSLSAECEKEKQKCFGPYQSDLEAYVGRGCRGERVQAPGHYSGNHRDDCYDMLTACGDRVASIEGELERTYDEWMRRCPGRDSGNAPGSGDQVDLAKGAKKNSTTPVVPTVPVIPKPKKVYFDLTFKVFLSGREECREKEEKAKAARKDATVGKGVDDSHVYCDRFYPPVDGLEGKTGNNPLEISNRIAESEKAGLRFGKVKASLEFETTEECVKEIRRLDGLYGNLIAFFGSYSKDLNEVCQAIRDDKIGALWQLQTGKKPRSVTGARR